MANPSWELTGRDLTVWAETEIPRFEFGNVPSPLAGIPPLVIVLPT